MDARVIDLIAWKASRPTPGRASGAESDDETAIGRVERAMGRLEARLRSGARLGARHETDLLAITGALALGMVDEAAERLERLAGRVEHPAGRGGA